MADAAVESAREAMTDAAVESDVQAAAGVFGVTIPSLDVTMAGIVDDPEKENRKKAAMQLLTRNGKVLFAELLDLYIREKTTLAVSELGVVPHDINTGTGLQTRRTSASGIDTHRDALETRGFMQNYSMFVTEMTNSLDLDALVRVEGGPAPKYGIIDGNHRAGQIKKLVMDAHTGWTPTTQVNVVILAGLPVSVYHRLWFEANRFNTKSTHMYTHTLTHTHTHTHTYTHT